MMKRQFIEVLEKRCRERSAADSSVRWWFSQHQVEPRRLGGFSTEGTVPLSSSDPDPIDGPSSYWRRSAG